VVNLLLMTAFRKVPHGTSAAAPGRLLPVNGSGIAADAQPESRSGFPAASEFDSEGWS
jgi:hypothetical protein